MNDLIPVDYSGQRVLTTEQLAQAYECEPHQISHNFKNNETKFTAGVHYYKLTGNDLKDFKQKLGNDKICQNLKFAPVIYLWTRRGASRHSKMLGTDRAWEMFDALEENYSMRGYLSACNQFDTVVYLNPKSFARSFLVL